MSKTADLKAELEAREFLNDVGDPHLIQDVFPNHEFYELYEFRPMAISSSNNSAGEVKIRCVVKNFGLPEEVAYWQNGSGEVSLDAALENFKNGISKLKIDTGCFNAWRVLEIDNPNRTLIVKALIPDGTPPVNPDSIYPGTWKTFSIVKIPSGDRQGWNIIEVPNGGLYRGDDFTDA